MHITTPYLPLSRRSVLALGAALALRPARAQPKVLRCAVPQGGYPPLFIHSPTHTQHGLALTLLQALLAGSAWRLELVAVPYADVAAALERGQVDIALSAQEWVTDPERFLFTQPMFRVRDVVLSRKDDPFLYVAPRSLAGYKVGTIRGYLYPSLDKRFSAGQMYRQDQPDELRALQALLKGDIQVQVANEWVAAWWIKTQGWTGQLVYSKQEVAHYDMRWMLLPQQRALLQWLNQRQRQLQKQGQWDRLQAPYLPDPAIERR